MNGNDISLIIGVLIGSGIGMLLAPIIFAIVTKDYTFHQAWIAYRTVFHLVPNRYFKTKDNSN